MKKIIYLVSIFIFLFISLSNISAKSNDIEITNVEIIEKSEKVKSNIKEYTSLNINFNTLFFSKDDYIKYSITIKNNTKNTYKNRISSN